MTGIPGPNTSQLAALLARLNQNIGALNKSLNKAQSGNSVLSKNIDSYNKLRASNLDLTDVIGNVTKVMSRMDDLQKRSLALGTTSNKFISQNNETLKKT